MGTDSQKFDLRELAQDIVGLVKERSRSAAGPTKPADSKIETAVLSTLASEPKNAVEISKSLTLAGAGAWQPTSGEIQRCLAKLETEKLVSSKLEGDRKIYSLTKAGKAAIKTAADAPEVEAERQSFGQMSAWMSRCRPEFLRAASKIAPAMIDIAKTGTQEQQVAAAAVLDETRNRLHKILAEN